MQTQSAREKVWGKEEADKAFHSRDGRFNRLRDSFIERIAKEGGLERGISVELGRAVMLDLCSKPLIETLSGRKLSLIDELAYRGVRSILRDRNDGYHHAVAVARQLAGEALERTLPKHGMLKDDLFDPTRADACPINAWVFRNFKRRLYEKLNGRREEPDAIPLPPDEMEKVLYPIRGGTCTYVRGDEAPRPDPQPDAELRERFISIEARERRYWMDAAAQIPGSGLFSAGRLKRFERKYWPVLGMIIDSDPKTRKLAEFERHRHVPQEAAKADAPFAQMLREFPDLHWSAIADLCDVSNGKQARDALKSFIMDIAQASPDFASLLTQIVDERRALVELLRHRVEAYIGGLDFRQRKQSTNMMERFSERLGVQSRPFLFIDPDLVTTSVKEWKASSDGK